MSTLNIDEPIELRDGTTHQFVSRAGSLIRLRNHTTGGYHDMHIAELSQQTIGLPRTFTERVREFDTLAPRKRDAAMSMADHLEEVITGQNPALEKVRPEYCLDTTTQNERIAAKVDELRRSGQKASRATLMRRLAKYREHGASALADRRAFRSDGPLDNLDPDVFDALCSVIADQTNRSTGTKSRLIHETQALLLKTHGADAPPMPSTASMYRYISVLTEGKHTTGSASTRRSLANRPAPVFAKRIELLPGNEVQVDSTTLDVFVRTPDGKAVRPILTVLFDRATRLVLAFTLRLVAAKAVDHVTLLAQALTPPQNRPDNTRFRTLVQRMNPNVPLLSAEERRAYDRTRPFVHPRTIVMDNGKDYISNTFLAALQLHGCDVRFSAPHTPTSKPLVERNFGSLATLFVQYLNGYTGRSPEFRGYRVEDEGIMDIFALHELLDDWLMQTWNHRPHAGLKDRLDPSVALTPFQMYLQASKLTSNLETTLTRDDYIAMLPTVYRKVTDTGVVVHYREFDAGALNPLRHQRSANARRKGKHAVKLDPYNPLFAWVEDPAGGWIECTVRDIDVDLYPHLEDRDVDLADSGDDRGDVAAVTAALTGTPLHTTITDPSVDDPADAVGDDPAFYDPDVYALD